jgi:ATP-dependent Lon protease
MREKLGLASIRCNTEHDLSDAVALASKIFTKASCATLDETTFEFSKNLFIGVVMEIAYMKENGTINDVLKFLVDPEWDSEQQILKHLQHTDVPFKQVEAAIWRNDFVKTNKHISHDAAERLIKRCHAHWKSVLSASSAITPKKPRPRGCMQVFNQEAVANAIFKMGDLKNDKKASSGHILENAQVNDGYRSVPNVKKAGLKIIQAKANFENLAEPINYLQSRLILAGCMKPDDFLIPPILLLGEPGIGKTYLAMQLAKSLGVPMEIISAAGTQGGFQFTGSHSSWTSARPGVVVSLLARGESAAPVVVVDEVDKIRDSQYPVLPVLLDLFERETSKQFKDEFFEMQFDASKIIYVLTANTLEGIPTSLLSRCEIFEVPRPLPKQRLQIIEEVAKKLRIKTGMPIELDKSTSKMLAERTDVDLREVTRMVEEAFAKAIQNGKTIAYLWEPKRRYLKIENDLIQPEGSLLLH